LAIIWNYTLGTIRAQQKMLITTPEPLWRFIG